MQKQFQDSYSLIVIRASEEYNWSWIPTTSSKNHHSPSYELTIPIQMPIDEWTNMNDLPSGHHKQINFINESYDCNYSTDYQIFSCYARVKNKKKILIAT